MIGIFTIKVKKVEIRVTTDKELKCIIKEINWYQNEWKLLTFEGTKYTLSSTNDIEECIKSINSCKNYTNGIK